MSSHILIICHLKYLPLVEGNPKASFSIATTPRCRGRCHSFPRIAPLYPWSFLIMLSVKQGGIKYHFLSLWYDSTWDWIRSPGPLANTLTIIPISGQIFCTFLCIFVHFLNIFIHFCTFFVHFYIFVNFVYLVKYFVHFCTFSYISCTFLYILYIFCTFYIFVNFVYLVKYFVHFCTFSYISCTFLYILYIFVHFVHLVKYFVHFQELYYSHSQSHIIGLLVINPCHGYIFLPCFGFLENMLVVVVIILVAYIYKFTRCGQKLSKSIFRSKM